MLLQKLLLRPKFMMINAVIAADPFRHLQAPPIPINTHWRARSGPRWKDHLMRGWAQKVRIGPSWVFFLLRQPCGVVAGPPSAQKHSLKWCQCVRSACHQFWSVHLTVCPVTDLRLVSRGRQVVAVYCNSIYVILCGLSVKKMYFNLSAGNDCIFIAGNTTIN